MRWKAVIPLLILTAAAVVATMLFLDPLVKRILVRAGQAIFGAEVEIASLRIRLRDTSLRLRGVQIADKSEPMKNLAQLDEAVFDAKFLPLLEKKVIIDQASLTGLQFGAPRKTSGALPVIKEKPSVATQLATQAATALWSKVETFSLERWASLQKEFDPRKFVKPEELASVKTAENAKSTLTQLPTELKGQIDRLNVKERTEALRRKVENLKPPGGSAGLTADGEDALAVAAQKLEAVQAVQKDLNSLKTDLESARSTVTAKIQSAEKLIQEVKKAKEDDWNRLRSLLQLPSFDTASIARLLFGPAIVAKVERVLGWVAMARRYMPAKAQEPPPPPRGKGRLIEFPRQNQLPRFLLAKAELSGELGMTNPLQFSGTLQGLTSNPPLYGKPLRLDLRGAQGPRTLAAQALVDHTREAGKESFHAEYKGFSVAGLSFGQEDSLGLSVQKGVGKAEGGFAFSGDALQGRLQLEGSQLSVQPRMKPVEGSEIVKRLQNELLAALSQVDRLNVEVQLSGTLSSPTMAIQSNVGAVVGNALKSALGKEIDAQKKALEAELNRVVQGRLKELEGMLNEQKDKALSQFSSQNKIVEDLLAQVKKEAGKAIPLPKPASVPGAEKALDQLKGLFGK